MSGIVIRSFAGAEERVTFDHGRVDLVTASLLALGREVLEPGWRWSVHVKPIVGTERCEFHRAVPGSTSRIDRRHELKGFAGAPQLFRGRLREVAVSR
jgi:hypothetical protein